MTEELIRHSGYIIVLLERRTKEKVLGKKGRINVFKRVKNFETEGNQNETV